MKQLDMSGVEPTRIDEMRRRVRETQAYLAISNPTDRDRREHADRLGLSVNQFLALVRAWKEHGTAAAISGAGAARGTARPTGPRNLPTESKDVARAVLASLGSETPHVEAARAIEARCAALGVKAPSRSTIWNMAMAQRRDAASEERPEGIVVSRCNAKLPVKTRTGIEFPSVVLAIDTATGAVLAAAIGDDATVASAISAGLARNTGIPTLIDANIAAAIATDMPSDRASVAPAAARTATAKAIGRGIGRIDLIYQLSRAARPESTLRSKKDRPLSPRDAEEVLGEQIRSHNAARSAAPAIIGWEMRHRTESAAALRRRW